MLVRYFRLIFFTRNDPRLAVSAQSLAITRPKNRKKVRGFEGEIMPDASDSLVPRGDQIKIDLPSASSEPTQFVTATSTSATNGEPPSTQIQPGEGGSNRDDTETSKIQETTESQQTILQPEPQVFEMQFSLAEIAHATDLREEDVAFALVHSGLANYRSPIAQALPASADILDQKMAQRTKALDEMQIVITAAIVEDVAAQFKVKQQPVLSKLHCLF